MKVYFNPLDKGCKTPIGAVKYGEEITLTVKAPVSDATLIIKEDKSGNLTNYKGEKVNNNFVFKLNNLKVGLYWYAFNLGGNYYGRNEELNLVKSKNISYYQLIVYNNNFKTPSWFKGGVIYQIFPDRFCKKGKNFKLTGNKIARNWGEQPFYKPNADGKMLNNDFFGGNLKGVISKLSYLKSLGVSVIYLNPITKAFSNHRYDTGNYLQIDELLGDENDFKNLCKKANENGIKIILDGVFNHTGDDSIYFNKYGNYDSVGAYQSENSPYKNWYIFEKHPDKYKCWWDILILPTINKNSVEFENFIAGDGGVIEKYMRLGASGIRLDVVDELPSSFVKKIRSKIKNENPNGVIIGEVWEDATNKIAYDTRKEYFLGGELDSVMNYPLKNAIINYALTSNSVPLKNLICEQINNYPKPALDSLMNILDTHDTSRILTVLGRSVAPKTRDDMAITVLSDSERELAVNRLKIAVTLQFTLYGVPSVYYGDEVGMQGESDPFNRLCYPWGLEDKKILTFYKKISQIRKKYDIFIDGETEILSTENGIFVFKRVKNDKEIIVAVNLGEYAYNLTFNKKVTELFSNTKNDKFTIRKYDFIIIKV